MTSGVFSSVNTSIANCFSRMTFPSLIALIVLLLGTTLLEAQDFIVAIVGVIAYLVFSVLKEERRSKARAKTISCEDDEVTTCKTPVDKKSSFVRKPAWEMPKRSSQTQRNTNPYPVPHPPSKIQLRHEVTKAPFKPVSFCSVGWDAQVQELLRQIEPTPESRKLVQGVERITKQAIKTSLSCAEVVGYASANPLAMKAFGIVVPEVDIVVNVPPSVLKQELVCGRMNTLKVGLRTITDALVIGHGFKFRRSAFQADEPRVVLNATPVLGLAQESFGINFYLNTPRPSQANILFEECAQLEPRARDLILLVRRWARDRAILHPMQSTKLSPYVWTLLTVYFLQVGERDEGPLLPAMTAIDGVLRKRRRVDPQSGCARKNLAALLTDFFEFYSTEFDWSREVVSIGEGMRCYTKALDSHMLVVDPFDKHAKLTESLTEAGVTRLQDELNRAKMLCSSPEAGTLAELLVPWTPPDSEAASPADAENEGSETAVCAHQR